MCTHNEEYGLVAFASDCAVYLQNCLITAEAINLHKEKPKGNVMLLIKKVLFQRNIRKYKWYHTVLSEPQNVIGIT